MPRRRFCVDVCCSVDDTTCNECLTTDLTALSECFGAIDYYGDACSAQVATMCCYSEGSGNDCLGNDAFFEYFQCPGVGLDPSCDTRTCDGATGGGTSPTPSTTTSSTGGDANGGIPPSSSTDDSMMSPGTSLSSSAPSSSPTLFPPSFTLPPGATLPPAVARSDATPAPTEGQSGDGDGGGGGGGGVADGEGDTPAPTSTAERALVTGAPTTGGDTEESDASGTNGAGLGSSWSPIGIVAAGLVTALALVGV